MEVVGPRGASEQSLTASRLRLAAGLLFTLAVAAFLTAVVASGEAGVLIWLFVALTGLEAFRGLRRLLRPPRFLITGGQVVYRSREIEWASPSDNIADLRRLDDGVLVTFFDTDRVLPEGLRPMLRAARRHSGVHLELQAPLGRRSEARLRQLLGCPSPDEARVDPRIALLTRPTTVVPAVLVVLTVVFVAMVVSGAGLLLPGGRELLAWGALIGPLALGPQPWRLLTSTLVHIGIIHLMVNAWVLLRVGPTVERLLGGPGFAVAYLISGLAGSLVAAVRDPGSIVAGASGAIFGLFGVLLTYVWRHGQTLPPHTAARLKTVAIVFVVLNLMLGASVSFISQAAHVGGFIAGLLVALPLVQPLGAASRRSSLVRAGATLATGVVLLGACVPLAAAARRTSDGWVRGVVFLLGRDMAEVGEQWRGWSAADEPSRGAFSARLTGKTLPRLWATRRLLAAAASRPGGPSELAATAAEWADLLAEGVECEISRLPTDREAMPVPACQGFRARWQAVSSRLERLLDRDRGE